MIGDIQSLQSYMELQDFFNNKKNKIILKYGLLDTQWTWFF